MFFDASIQTFDIQVISVPDEDGPHVILQLLLGLTVPGPSGQKGVLPAGAIKVPIGREMAIGKAKELLEAAEALPEPKPESDLIIAGNMDQAKQVADIDTAVRSGQIPVE
jgi:hypothetical protein